VGLPPAIVLLLISYTLWSTVENLYNNI
jgi:hypothetical protein